MAGLEYKFNNRKVPLEFSSFTSAPPVRRSGRRGGRRGLRRGVRAVAGPAMAEAVNEGHALAVAEAKKVIKDKSQRDRLWTRFQDVDSDDKMIARTAEGLVIPTETLVLVGANRDDKRKVIEKFGAEEVQAGYRGNSLLLMPEGGEAGVEQAFAAAAWAVKNTGVRAAQPNLLSLTPALGAASTGSNKRSWGLDNLGKPGVVGADVAALAAWTITEGDSDIKVAVLDEGVDSNHPWLKNRIIDELDMVDENSHARPDGDDAHGTACAGVIASDDSDTRGLAPGVSLLAARIAKGSPSGWVGFDNMDTAEAILWACAEKKAHVISNSWVCSPSDVIRLAITDAIEMGCLVVGAAGNGQSTSISFPASVKGVLTVGASNQWDKRKTKSSQDGEKFWGSNSGPELDLLAPGVAITTADISGERGKSKTDRYDGFNGTSSATPLVAATAALMLSVNKKLKVTEIVEIIRNTADPLTADRKHDDFVGFGRLNTFAALRAARKQ